MPSCRSQLMCLIVGLAGCLAFETAFAQATGPVDLFQSFRAASEKTEVLPIEEARLQQAKEKLRQAKGGIFPHLSLNGSYLKQDTPDFASNGSGAAAGFTRTEQTSTRLTATQPLFQGFREFSAFRMLRSNIEAQTRTKDFARLSLFSTVAQTYFEVLSSEKDLANIRDLIDVTERRIKSLQSFTRLGRSPRTDLLSSQAQLASLRAEEAAAVSTRDQARQRFALVTGLPPETALLDARAPLPEKLAPSETYLTTVETRPDIQSLKSLENAAQANIRIAKGAYWPTVNFTGNYYLNRTGSLEGTKWDFGVTLSLPLYEGGVLVSQVREASSSAYEATLNLQRAVRTAQQEILVSYKAAASGIEQMRLLKEAVALAEKTYRQQTRNYSNRSSTNLDVLQALNSLETARRLLDRTYYQTRLSLISLSLSQGRLPEETPPQG